MFKEKMATTTPLSYNTGSTISGTIQIGNLSVGTTAQDYSTNPGGVKWWMGPDEDLGYVIAQSVSGNTQPTPLSGVTASVGFFRSDDLTESSFITLSETISGQSFANGNDAVTWLNNNGYWTSYIPVPLSPTPTPTLTPTRTPRPTVTPTVTPTNTPYPPNTYFFFRPEGSVPGGLTSNGQLEFTTNGASEVTYNPNITDEISIYLTDKSGLYHPDYLDVVTYGGVLTMTQGSNTAILSGNTIDTGQWGNYGSYITGSYLEVVQASPNPFVSGSPINLVLTVNYPPTPTNTPTNTPTPSSTPTPVTGYSFNLVATPYNFPSAGNSIMNGPGGATSGSTDINVLATGGRGFYFNSFDNDGIDRTSYYSGFTGQSVTITFNQTGNTAIYSGDTNSFKQWIQSPISGFVFGANIGVPPSGTPSGTAVLIQSAATQYTIGSPVYVSLVVN